MANSFIPINPKTGKAYRDGQPRKFKSWIGLRDNRTGEIKRIYERHWEDVRDLVQSVGDEKLPLKKVDKAVAKLEYVPEVIFVNRRGFEIERPKAGQLGKWAVRDTKGDAWLFQLPAMTPPVPGRIRGVDHEGRVVRSPSKGPVQISEVQKYSPAAHKLMQASLESDRMVLVFVNTAGEVVPLRRGQYQVAYRLDSEGRDSELHEKLMFVKWDPFELTMLKSKRVTDVYRGEWSPWVPLDEEKSVRDSIGRLSAKLDADEIREIRDEPSAFLQVNWRAKVRDAGGEYRLMGWVDVRKDAEMLVKAVSVDITKKMFAVGLRHTRLTKIAKEDGTNFKFETKFHTNMRDAGGWDAQRQRDDRVNMLVEVSPVGRGEKYLRRETGKVVGASLYVPLNRLDQILEGEIQFSLDIKYFGKSTRKYKARR